MTNQKRDRADTLALFSLVHLLVPPGGRSYKLLSHKMSEKIIIKKWIVARLIRKRIGRGKNIYINYFNDINIVRINNAYPIFEWKA